MKAITIYSGGSVMTVQGMEYYPAAEVDAYRQRVRALMEAAKESHCPKCGGAGWVWGYELDDADHDTATDTMTRYTCDWCRRLKAALAAMGEDGDESTTGKN